MTDLNSQRREQERPIVDAYLAVRISMEDLARLAPEQSRAVMMGFAQLVEVSRDR